MKVKYPCLFFFALATMACGPQKYVSTITGGEYNKNIDRTEYLVMPYGATSMQGEWKKGRYADESQQQFFTNADGFLVGVAFVATNSFEFNTNGSKKGTDFLKAYYNWEVDYFTKQGYSCALVEESSSDNFIVWRLYDDENVDTYFLFAEKNGSVKNFSIAKATKWGVEQKTAFLKDMLLYKDN